MKKLLKLFLLASFILGIVSNAAYAAQIGFDSHNNRDRRHEPRYHNSLSIKTHVQGDGWIGPFYEGDVAGTVGQSKRMEAISITSYDGTRIRYRVYVDGLGWSNWASHGQVVGTIGESRAITAIELTTDGRGSDVAYQVHVADRGWLDWLYAGSVAGDFQHPIEAISIVLQ